MGDKGTTQQRCETSLCHCNSTQITLSAYLNRGIARYKLGYQQLALIDLQQAARRFTLQGNTNAYQQTLQFIQSLQQELVSFPESELG